MPFFDSLANSRPESRFTSSLKQGDESQDSSTAPHETIAAEKEALRKIFQETVDFLSPNRLSQHLDELDKHLASLLTTSEWRLKLRNQWIARVKEYLQQSAILKNLASSSNPLETVSGAGYESIKTLGKGGYGVVELVKQKDNQYPRLYARKSKIIHHGEEHSQATFGNIIYISRCTCIAGICFVRVLYSAGSPCRNADNFANQTSCHREYTSDQVSGFIFVRTDQGWRVAMIAMRKYIINEPTLLLLHSLWLVNIL